MKKKPILGPGKMIGFACYPHTDKGWYWFETEGPAPTEAEKSRFIATPEDQRNGPFTTREQAERASDRAMVGGVRVIKKPGWPFGPGSASVQ